MLANGVHPGWSKRHGAPLFRHLATEMKGDRPLRLAGVDPADYDLARILPTGGTESFRDATIVKITNGNEFVTAKHVGDVA